MKLLSEREIKKKFQQLSKRSEELRQSILQQAVEDLLERLQSQKSKYPYLEKLEIVRAGDEIAIILLDAETILSDWDEEGTVFRYIPAPAKVYSQSWNRILGQFGPFVKEMVPIKAKKAGFVLSARRVTSQEVSEVRERNRTQRDDLLLQLRRAGASKEYLENVVEESVQEDWIWRIVRGELGIRTQKEPVWLPELRRFLSGENLNEMLKPRQGKGPLLEQKVARAENIRVVSASELLQVGGFQEEITKKV